MLAQNVIQALEYHHECRLRLKQEIHLMIFWKPNYMSLEETATLDVHGNQYGLLTVSQCFIKSEGLTYSTFHNPHKNQRDQLKQFSQKCIGCHQGATIHKFDLKDQMKTNCIDCHMPFYRLLRSQLTRWM
jgi:hypothetical protein